MMGLCFYGTRIINFVVFKNGYFKYIGLNIVETENEVFVDQDRHVELLRKIDLSRQHLLRKDALLNETEKKQLVSYFG